MFARTILTALLLAVGLAPPAAAQDYAAALDALNRQEYAAARQQLRPLAEAGDAEAQAYLAALHLRGLGIAPDTETARRWYQAAAAQGHAVAQYELARMAERGDPAEAAQLYQQAAEQGLFRAQIALAGLYAAGRGVPRDPVEAVKWYNIALHMGLDPDGRQRDAVVEGMSEAQIAEAARRAGDWLAAYRRKQPAQ